MNFTQLSQAIQDYSENYEETFIENIPTFIQQAEKRIYNSVQIPSLRKNVTGVTQSGNKYLSAPSDFLSTYSLAVYPVITTTATGTSGEFSLTLTSYSGVAVGQSVSGTNIGTGALVRSISGNTVILTSANTGTVNGTVTFTGDYLYLLNKDVNFMREAYPQPTDTGLPKYYALFGPATSGGTITDELTFILGPTPDIAYTAELHFYYYPESITTAESGRTWLGDNFDTVLLYGSLVEAYTFMKGEQDLISYYENKYQEALSQLQRLSDGLERGDFYRDGQTKLNSNLKGNI